MIRLSWWKVPKVPEIKFWDMLSRCKRYLHLYTVRTIRILDGTYVFTAACSGCFHFLIQMLGQDSELSLTLA